MRMSATRKDKIGLVTSGLTKHPLLVPALCLGRGIHISLPFPNFWGEVLNELPRCVVGVPRSGGSQPQAPNALPGSSTDSHSLHANPVWFNVLKCW